MTGVLEVLDDSRDASLADLRVSWLGDEPPISSSLGAVLSVICDGVDVCWIQPLTFRVNVDRFCIF